MKLNIVLGIVTIAIAFIIFPVILDGTNTILGNTHISDYTGLASVVKIAPMIVFVAMVFGGGLLTWTGVKQYRTSKKSKGRN